MPRLIDAHELWGQIYILSVKHRWKDRTNIAFSKCLDAIQFFPTVDAVEVVRCKDCKHYYADPWGWGNCVFEGGVSRRTKTNDFCSWGERREDDSK